MVLWFERSNWVRYLGVCDLGEVNLGVFFDKFLVVYLRVRSINFLGDFFDFYVELELRVMFRFFIGEGG